MAGASPSLNIGSEPTSPIDVGEKRVVSQPPTYAENTHAAGAQQPAHIQTSGITGGANVASPTQAGPGSAVDHAHP